MDEFLIEQDAPPVLDAAAAPPTDEWVGEWPQTAQAFEALVDAYLARLVLYASRRLRNIQDAEDVVQDVLVRAYEGRARHSEVREVGAYLYRMTSNACTDVLRRRQRGAQIVPFAGAGHEQLADPQENVAQTLQATEAALRAERLLQRLPAAQAEAIRLRIYGDLTLDEVAKTTGCSINTVCSRLRYGFEKLRRIVAREKQI